MTEVPHDGRYAMDEPVKAFVAHEAGQLFAKYLEWVEAGRPMRESAGSAAATAAPAGVARA